MKGERSIDMAKVIHDSRRCQSMGVCESLAPDVFELNDQAELVLLTDGEVSDAQLAKVRAEVAGCPTGALRLAEDLRCPRSVDPGGTADLDTA